MQRGCGDSGLAGEDAVVLLHSDVEWDVVVFGPAAQRVEEQGWPLEALGPELFVRVRHEQGVAIVHWVTELEGEDGIGFTRLELCLELERGLSVLIQTVTPRDLLEHLELTTDEEVTGSKYLFHVGVALGTRT